MERIFLTVLVLCVVMKSYHTKATHYAYGTKEPHLKKEMCSPENDALRHKLDKESRCGKPREVLQYLKASSALSIMPTAVWVKRCVGHCSNSGRNCTATKTRIRSIPVRVSSAENHKEYCASYELEEHLECSCEKCEGPKILNPRKSICQCPNVNDRMKCKRSLNMRWNHNKCICQPKR